jgi:hypothetical protein
MGEFDSKMMHQPVAIADPDIGQATTFEQNTFFRCCSGSGTCDRRLLKFFATFFITTVVAFFSMFQLYNVDKCDSDIYVTLLTMSISIWVPAPSLSIKKL